MQTLNMTADAGEAASGRGRIAFLAIAAHTLPILGATSVAPIQPMMARTFADQAGIEVLVAMVLTLPALVIGLTALFAGRIIDALGRKRVMIIALLLYAVFGTAPYYLPTLQQILISRVLTGVTEAAIFTITLALIADYFVGHQRAKYYAMLAIAAGFSTVIFIGVSGAIGAASWRATFLLYAISLPLLLVAIFAIPSDSGSRHVGEKLPPMDWSALAVPFLIALAAGISFYSVVVMMPFRLEAVGIPSPAVIGIVGAAGSFLFAVFAYIFPSLLNRVPGILFPLSFFLVGIGDIGMGFGDNFIAVSIASLVTYSGAGLLIPASQNWTLQHANLRQRGRASGGWASAMFIGEFVCPLIIFGLASKLGMHWSMSIVGVAALVLCLLSAAFIRLRPNTEVAAG